jgi:hypothetical protein
MGVGGWGGRRLPADGALILVKGLVAGGQYWAHTIDLGNDKIKEC